VGSAQTGARAVVPVGVLAGLGANRPRVVLNLDPDLAVPVSHSVDKVSEIGFGHSPTTRVRVPIGLDLLARDG
jgi:hypothetical protein